MATLRQTRAPSLTRIEEPQSPLAIGMEQPPTSVGPHEVGTTPWHALPIESVVERLATRREQGLSAEESRRRLLKFGLNSIRVALGTGTSTWWRSFRWAAPGWTGRRWKRER